MASAIIHICVANEINKKLNLEEKSLFLGSIAPDISKQVGETKDKSHFLTTAKEDIPNISEFLEKYKKQLTDPFLLGYFIHLYTDKLWFGEFIRQRIYENKIKLLDGTIIPSNKEEIRNFIYNDYTNVNISLIDYYHLDLSLFYEEVILPKIEMDEIPIQKLQILVDKMGVIIENSKEEKVYIFDISVIIEFIKYATEKILKKIKEYQLKIHP